MADTTYRTGFGTGAFGVRAYGVDGVLKDGEAIVIGVTSTAAANVRVRLSGSIIASTLFFLLNFISYAVHAT